MTFEEKDKNRIISVVASLALIITYGVECKDLWTNDKDKRTKAITNITWAFVAYSFVNGVREANYNMSSLFQKIDKAIITDANFALCFSAIISNSLSPALDAYAVLYFTYAFYLIFEFLKPYLKKGPKGEDGTQPTGKDAEQLCIHPIQFLIHIIIIFIMISTAVLSLSKETITDELLVKI